MIILYENGSYRDGFTILEILVAIAILAMIFTMVFGTFFYTVKNAEEQEEHAVLYHRASFILNNLSQSISSAFVPLSEIYLAAEDREPSFAAEDVVIEEADADSLATFTSNARFGAREQGGEVSYVTYEVSPSEDIETEGWLEDKDNPLVLTCTIDLPLKKSENDDSNRLQWKMNINSLNFEFFDGTSWLQDWSYDEQGVLPTAVKIHLEIADSTGAKQAFSTTAFIHANALMEELPEEAAVEEAAEEETQEEEVELDEDVKEKIQENIDEGGGEAADKSAEDEDVLKQ